MEFGADENDLVRLTLGDDSATIHLFGATIISWKTGAVKAEHIYLSKTAIFDNKKAIRGGVPFVFPNFGPWSLGPHHGFARISMWSLQRREPSKAVFKLTETQTSLDMWPFKFEVFYTVELATGALHMRVDVCNTDDKIWDFTLLLHTHLKVEDIAKTKIRGLDKVSYIDKLKRGSNATQVGDVIITEAIDRIYRNTADVEVSDGSTTILVEKNGLPDTVVWNPWVKGCASISDLDNDAWQKMVCVEAGKVTERVILQPGEIYIAKGTLRLID
ncbi:putative glucose-6-phosphate 1-epimerase [Varroa jacobsoni]|uniref:glucose-6-phosphate 1-epimerase n=1 Tax=Varroa destructor TaxID=109461 RepID=A0A7M7KQZ8_VARDE|nr:putative glucose-6-phosphate 1-epimerase [Varroa destructor]XP_022669467.1 putative glucose-6-phosphate 1-epimerase [Varroa destructor]XP_022669468.1 putative glucose-6-phosphate 1-epimerase [Varroa destructor]XP_022692304.1 putative glucose-6-phosphate 1-epimerase [Varroa jacobsoni]XP_022692313.1 putative glucose-6-phosphate 1-epimerase [Varroa jacobsoni]